MFRDEANPCLRPLIGAPFPASRDGEPVKSALGRGRWDFRCSPADCSHHCVDVFTVATYQAGPARHTLRPDHVPLAATCLPGVVCDQVGVAETLWFAGPTLHVRPLALQARPPTLPRPVSGVIDKCRNWLGPSGRQHHHNSHLAFDGSESGVVSGLTDSQVMSSFSKHFNEKEGKDGSWKLLSD